ncbi:tail fiber assembly protein [Citrobacter koseri]|uniref:tail fiber assembly protein n=1 Tax=Citrobacter koseri TaxID=545 RepID=UPI000E159205|nr:tail fiber assembly protein [Citrobacter koseri]MBJ8673143.1 tail fiber assembly protein [Citrobacter koseri]MBJ8764707.1 tail fiber assembly protein [Citrobacter koseri]MBJ9232179.1 tail fiber assembly protein [Citrobacter koseri]SUX96595.1 phage tail fiber assembly protein [Citrobacter koseri]HEM6682597.1 tail fiber assembly protein [Citrobacter koseri]
MKYWFSGESNAFYPIELKTDYLAAGSLPADLVEVSSAVFAEYSGPSPENKVRGVDAYGFPAWQDVPPPTAEDLMVAAENMQQALVNQALDHISDKQWQGKAAIGRLKDDERAEYNAWLDYLDELDVVDLPSAPTVNWPSQPEK